MIEHNLYIPLSTEDVLPDHSTVEPESIIRWAADKFLQIPFLRNMTLKLMTVKIICQNFKINYQLQPPLSSKKNSLESRINALEYDPSRASLCLDHYIKYLVWFHQKDLHEGRRMNGNEDMGKVICN